MEHWIALAPILIHGIIDIIILLAVIFKKPTAALDALATRQLSDVIAPNTLESIKAKRSAK